MAVDHKSLIRAQPFIRNEKSVSCANLLRTPCFIVFLFHGTQVEKQLL